MQLLNPNVSLSELRELVMDREAWRAVIHWVAKSRTRLSDWTELNWMHVLGFLGGASGKEPSCQCRRGKRCGFHPWVGKIPWRRAWQPTPVFFPGKSPWTEEPGRLQSIGSHDWSTHMQCMFCDRFFNVFVSEFWCIFCNDYLFIVVFEFICTQLNRVVSLFLICAYFIIIHF